MEVEVHQIGGVLGLDRRYVFKDGLVEVIDRGRRTRKIRLEPEQVERIDKLAALVSDTEVRAGRSLHSDDMQTTVDIRRLGHRHSFELHSGDVAPAEMWDLIDVVSRS